jgi:NADP-dependent 3-hydroxy acid dehydrogenase YdfG
MLSPDQRVILISGASRGIGKAVAAKLHADGYSLSLGGRDLGALQEMTREWDARRVHLAAYDARDWATHKAWVEAAAGRYGRIDGLVNNAGMNSFMTIRDADEAALDEVWAVNVKAPLNMIKCALPHLEASGAGRIINIASLSGKRVRNNNVAYTMSKFAVRALTHAVRRLSWDKGVRATAMCPSFVRTDMTSFVTTFPHEKMIDPDDFATLVATVIALPNTASIAEMLVNCVLEDMV